MKQKDSWIKFDELEFSDSENNRFNIDTRDFHAGYSYQDEIYPDLNKIQKYPDFFFTEEELIVFLNNLYIEAGSQAEWRFLELINIDGRVRNWRLKYLRIWRVETDKFIVCNCDQQAIPKRILNSKVNQETLNAH